MLITWMEAMASFLGISLILRLNVLNSKSCERQVKRQIIKINSGQLQI